MSSGDLLVRLNLQRRGRRPFAYLDPPWLHRLRDYLLQHNSQETVGERRRLDVNNVSQFDAMGNSGYWSACRWMQIVDRKREYQQPATAVSASD